MSDRNKVYETILLITNKDTMEEFKDMSVNDVLACNEGYYFERLLIGIDEEGNSKIVWDMKTDKEEIEGQRIHVHLLNGKRVDFFAELTNSTGFHAELINCSKEQYNGNRIYLPQDNSFGMDELDFFIFLGEKSKVIEGSFEEGVHLKATVEQFADEEDSEAPEVQHVAGRTLISTDYYIEVNEGLYVKVDIEGYAYSFTKDITKARKYKNEALAETIAKSLNGTKLTVKTYLEG